MSQELLSLLHTHTDIHTLSYTHQNRLCLLKEGFMSNYKKVVLFCTHFLELGILNIVKTIFGKCGAVISICQWYKKNKTIWKPCLPSHFPCLCVHGSFWLFEICIYFCLCWYVAVLLTLIECTDCKLLWKGCLLNDRNVNLMQNIPIYYSSTNPNKRYRGSSALFGDLVNVEECQAGKQSYHLGR